MEDEFLFLRRANDGWGDGKIVAGLDAGAGRGRLAVESMQQDATSAMFLQPGNGMAAGRAGMDVERQVELV